MYDKRISQHWITKIDSINEAYNENKKKRDKRNHINSFNPYFPSSHR